MGNVETITATRFPKQGCMALKRVSVCFNYDTTRQALGTVVRDDAEEPFQLIIRLDDGRFVRSVECQYRLLEP